MGGAKDTNKMSLSQLNSQIGTRGLKQRHNLVDNQRRNGLEVFCIFILYFGHMGFVFFGRLSHTSALK